MYIKVCIHCAYQEYEPFKKYSGKLCSFMFYLVFVLFFHIFQIHYIIEYQFRSHIQS